MKRPVKLLSMLAAMVLAAPAAMANDVVKCVDANGHVTLTDQPCATGAATVRLGDEALQRHVLPAAELRHQAWKRPDLARPAALARDVATLKAAHRTLLMQDARPRLDGLTAVAVR